MATRKDQLQSHQFSVQRMVSALVTRETDPEQPPFKRATSAAFGGVAIMILALAVVWVYGMVVPGGNKAWSKGDSVIVEKETGTRYVYLDGHLHPVANYVSALLAIGKRGQTLRVSQRSLAGVPRGPRIGIQDAPDALPPASKLLGGGWTLCSQPSHDQAGARTSESVLMIGQRPDAGTPMTEDAMLVQVLETGDQYLLSEGYRHRIAKNDVATVAVALHSQPVTRVGAAFVAALPDGQPIAPLRPAGVGTPTGVVPGRPKTLVGQLFFVQTSAGRQYYLATKKALLPISEVQYDIQRAYGPLKAAYNGKSPTAIELNLTAVSEAELPAVSTEEGAVPGDWPRFVGPRDGIGTVCAMFTPGQSLPAILIDPAMPLPDAMTATTKRTRRDTVLADRILITPGTAAVVESRPSDRAPAGTISVITDMGRAYPLSDPKLIQTLGYGAVKPIPIPAALIARIPQGPGLNPTTAIQPVP
ncbi:type VII secretion protein EccB [Kribbella speibonae]|uniref:Type VII secretion protein EccB n=1 Tax=Kribbella speibonae TaxID=1572660 RepID=A0ABY1ZZ68_9ACTN|nr:type VII secretion protein EccB [Kribbella speibonae]TCC19331.1 type VII secretion protein EccB [Kribbella speibonae]